MLNLDTHILVFALTDQLRPKEKDLLEKERWGKIESSARGIRDGLRRLPRGVVAG